MLFEVISFIHYWYSTRSWNQICLKLWKCVTALATVLSVANIRKHQEGTVLCYTLFATMNFVRRSVRPNFKAMGSRCCSGLIWIKLKLHQLLSLWNPSTKCHRNQFRSCRNETKHNHAMLSTLSIKKYKEEHRRYLGRVGWGTNSPPVSPLYIS